jgi:hypothetical protein
VAESNVKLRVDARDAVSALQQTNRASEKLNRTLGTTSKRAGTATANIQRFGISFRSVVGPMVALTGALTLANRSLNSFGKRQADIKVLSAQLERVGADGSKQLDELRAAADRLGDATLFSQDDFIESFNILSSFRAIAVESFTEVSEVAADIAQVMGSDVKSATVQLAKALEDPKRGLTALSRSGITFNEAQTETIKKLVDSGKLLDAQALVLETIKGQYEGAAEAAGKGFAGALDLLSENAEDAAEALGKGLEPAATAVANALAAVFEQVSKIPAPVGQAALALGTAALATKALNTAVAVFKASQLAAFIGTQIAMYKAFGAQIYLTAAAQGVLNTALAVGKSLLFGLPFVLVTGAVTAFVGQMQEAKQVQEDLNDLLETGTVKQYESALATHQRTLAEIEYQKTVKSLLPGALGRMSEAGDAAIENLTNRTKTIRNAIAVIEGQLAEGMIGGGSLPQDQPTVVVSDEELERLKRLEDRKFKLFAIEADHINEMREQEERRNAAEGAAIGQRLQRGADLIAQGQREIELLQGRIDGNEEEVALRHRIADINAMDLIPADKERLIAAELQIAAMGEQVTQIEKQRELYEDLDNTFRNGIVDAIMAAVDGTKSLSDSLVGVLKQMAQLILQRKLLNALSGFSITGFLGFANGGRPPVGRASIVGERGPELFVPDTAGTIIPNHQLGGGGGAMASNIVVNVDASGTSVEGNEGQSRQLGALIGAAVQTEIIKQQRPGGLLSR